MAVLEEDRRSPQPPEMKRLLQAVRRNDLATVSSILVQAPQLLTDREMSGEAENEGGWWTPLGLAARLGHTDICRLLLSKGADPQRVCVGYTGRDTKRKDLCEFGGQYTPAHLAALGCHARALRTLLEGGASATALDQYGSTPLYCASRQLSPECVQVLLELAGAQVVGLEVKNEENETPMMAALMGLHQAKISQGGLAKHRATAASASAVIAKLLEAGADPNDASATSAVDGKHCSYSTALLVALDAGLDDLAVLLHLHGAKLLPSGCLP